MDVEPVSTLVVSGRVDLTADVVLLDLADPEGADLPAWAPGAHVDLMLPGDMVRQYSLCGDPADRSRWQVGVLREADGRGGSIFVHDKLPVGTEVDVRGPRNNFPLEEADSYVFVAGGIGVTPLIPMIAAADARSAKWELVYGGRSRASMALVDDLVSRYGDRVSVRPQDEFGLLDINGLLGTARSGTAVYCCGPEPLLLAVESACGTWPEGALHIERFSPKAQAEPVLSGSFEVELALSEQVLTVSPDRSIVEVLEEAGIPVNVSCLEGTCGSCESAVLGGTPDHRDSVLTAEEQEANDIMMVCVSRSATPRLVLDL